MEIIASHLTRLFVFCVCIASSEPGPVSSLGSDKPAFDHGLRQKPLPNYFLSDLSKTKQGRSQYHSSISVFQHVHKSGGIMVRRFVEAIGKHRHLPELDPSQRLSAGDRRRLIAGYTGPSRLRAILRLQNGNLAPRREFQLIHGDHAFRYCDYLANPDSTTQAGTACAYWIVLRDPMERMVSDYRYCVDRGTWVQRLEAFRDGRGDWLCAATAITHFNDTAHRPTLAEWVSSRPKSWQLDVSTILIMMSSISD